MPSKKTPAGTRSVYPVPLYLVPHVLAAEMRQTEGEIAEITIRRGGWHSYLITVRVEDEEGEGGPSPS
ncbi:hypothetical protein RJ40_10390 [Methanofollis aquaemaris]|uniref:Uncharacterized protein n=1 Tax=Methanofollis aquaemaris TaxID=126734 RepID=A0A8A3S7G6_9EURY|nr:hypothetical protein [Methanofollis aquaemaris]QSZ67873.1 hypothetical protein RJ40_10390 [Methanofollis aquaemaris]